VVLVRVWVWSGRDAGVEGKSHMEHGKPVFVDISQGVLQPIPSRRQHSTAWVACRQHSRLCTEHDHSARFKQCTVL
jgi:hypothetical protein